MKNNNEILKKVYLEILFKQDKPNIGLPLSTPYWWKLEDWSVLKKLSSEEKEYVDFEELFETASDYERQELRWLINKDRKEKVYKNIKENWKVIIFLIILYIISVGILYLTNSSIIIDFYMLPYWILGILIGILTTKIVDVIFFERFMNNSFFPVIFLIIYGAFGLYLISILK